MIEHYDSADSLDAVIGLIVTGGFFGMVASLVTLANLCFDRLGRTKIILSAAGGAAAILAGMSFAFYWSVILNVQSGYDGSPAVIVELFFPIFWIGAKLQTDYHILVFSKVFIP